MPADVSGKRGILLLGHDWSSLKDGIVAVNRSLALHLAKFQGVSVYSTILSEISAADRADADKHGVTLLSPDRGLRPLDGDTVAEFNLDPLKLFSRLEHDVLPFVTHIIGHSPISAEAALNLKKNVTPGAKVILFYHVIPADVNWLQDALPYVVPTDAVLVEQGEEADVVYSVTEKLHWYYTAKFRNRAKDEVDHRLYIPQCSEGVFDINKEPFSDKTPAKLLSLGYGSDAETWQGLDISACSLNKVVASLSDDAPVPSLSLGGVGERDVTSVNDKLSEYVTDEKLQLDIHSHQVEADVYKDLTGSTICLIPSRAEPYGHLGLQAISSGIPTLMSENSAVGSLIKRLTSEPEYFLVPTTPTASAVRQDSSVWRDRISAMLRDPVTAHERSMQLKMALRRDEKTKETHDNFIALCLGGIRIKHEIISAEFRTEREEAKELPIMRSFNSFLLETMTQCWRLKHHPLTQDGDLFQLLPGLEIPINRLVECVTDKVEDRDRKIVGIDKVGGSFMVYCPTPDSLSDLWAMCDRINDALFNELIPGPHSKVLLEYGMTSAVLRTVISGPEFLRYKNQLMGCTEPY